MMRHLFLGLAALTLTACGVQDRSQGIAESEAGYYAEADLAPAPAVASAPREPAASEPSGVFLAYRYGYGVQLPPPAVKPTADKHTQMCQDAGPSNCQVMGSRANAYSDDNVSASLSLRAEPKWLETFVAAMRSDIETANGSLTTATTDVQDLTRSILDTDARLSAQRKLRGRLENLLETRDAKLPDLLALERELARVQGEIESATANLKALRARVSMSTVDITYTSETQAVSRSSFAPVARALKGFMRTLSEGLSQVIYFIAAILPWLIFVILPGLFLVRWVWRKRQVKPKA